MFCLPLNKTQPAGWKKSWHLPSVLRTFSAITLLSTAVFILCVFSSCAPRAYKSLQRTDGDAACLQKFHPQIQRVLYQAAVEVAGNHLSGILLIKHMPDSSLRLLFTNEAGFKFFDFEFSKSGDFKVHSIIEKMNKKAVKETLQKDFKLILMQMTNSILSAYKFKRQNPDERYFANQTGKDFYYYITNNACDSLLRMERGSRTRKVMDAFSEGLKGGVPETIRVRHNNFNFDIQLKRIYDHAE